MLSEYGGLTGVRDEHLLDSTLALAAGKMSEKAYAAWLKANSKRA